ncbi:iron chaperone [Pseudoroseicyclus sp. CXY001]|uniref:iron chaperone n=1 Tax=Pseudoroseicyclus sp. CXY001 TaxID=3242492 RepID=UPI00358DC4F6
MPAPESIDAYLVGLPEPAQGVIAEIRRRIATAAPEAEETIRYGMPAVQIGGRTVIHYAGWKAHAGLYPVYRGDAAYEAALAPWRDKKDTVRLPYKAEPFPWEIVEMILAARLAVMRAGGGGV